MSKFSVDKVQVLLLCFTLAILQAFASNNEIEATFSLLDQGRDNIKLSKSRDVVLVLGNTGAGKSTFHQWFVGDESKLVSEEISENEFIITDGDKIGSSNLNSKTIFPELIETDNIAFYDCPGFSDTRSTSHEIAISYFIKKISVHAKNVKIVLIVNYSSVRIGVDRLDFMKLLKHATEFIKNIDKFSKSIVLVVTKVDNEFLKIKRGEYVVVSDDKIIVKIGNFLKTLQKDFISELETARKLKSDKSEFLENALKLTQILLTKKNDRYSKIGLFRRPDQEGPLNEILLLKEGKKNIERIISEETSFTAKDESDFGYTVSDSSLNDINSLVNEINKNVIVLTNNIARDFMVKFQDLVEKEIFLVESFKSNLLLKIDSANGNKFSLEFKTAKQISENLSKSLADLNSVEDLVKLLNVSFTSVEFELSSENVEKLSEQGEFLKFLQKVSKKEFELSSSTWASAFQSIVLEFTSLEKSIETCSKNVTNIIMLEMNSDLKILRTEISYVYKTEFLKILHEPSAFYDLFYDDPKFTQIEEKIAVNLVEKNENTFKIVSDLAENSTNIELSREIVENIKVSINNLSMNLKSSEKMPKLLIQANYIDFLHHLGKVDSYSESMWFDCFDILKKEIISQNETFTVEALNIFKQISKQIINETENMAESIKSNFVRKIETFDFDYLSSIAKDTFDIVAHVIEKAEDCFTLEQLTQEITEAIIKLNMREYEIESIFFNATLKEKHLLFLSHFIVDSPGISLKEFVAPLNKIATYFNETANWYNFLKQLHEELSKYHFQKNKTMYNVANIDDWGLSGKSIGLVITKHNFNEFLDKMKQYNITAQNLIQVQEPMDQYIDEINTIIDATIKSLAKFDCNPKAYDELIIQGDYVKFSDFIGSDGQLLDVCHKTIKLRVVKVYALKMLFIDTNLIAIGNELQLTIIAPEWNIIGSRKIILDGEHGKPHQLQITTPGSSGKAGKPGGPAGSFFGIGDHCINCEKLVLTSTGGNGGPGQNGQNGQEGKIGDNGEYPSSKCVFNGYVEHDLPCYGSWLEFYVVYYRNVSRCRYKTFGSSGFVGKNGGNGGKSGFGGLAGEFKLKFFNDDEVFVKVFVDNGVSGKKGVGGKGGLGGRTGNTTISYCKHHNHSIYVNEWNTNSWLGSESETNNTRQSPGKRGCDDCASTPITTQSPVVNKNKAIDLNQYKFYLRNKLHRVSKKSSFYESLEQNKYVNSLYNTIGYIDELYTLEKGFQTLGVKSLQFYNSLLNRFNAAKKSSGKNSAELQKVEKYLKTAMLSKINYIQSNSGSELIINLNAYLTNVQMKIENLKFLKFEKTKTDVVKKHKKSFEAKIEKKSEEAMNFITNEIMPSIDEMKQNIDNEIDLLISEITILQKQAKNEKNELQHIQKKLKDTVGLSSFFNGLKILVQVLNLCGVYGAAAGAVVESFVIDSQNNKNLPFSLLPTVDTKLKLFDDNIRDMNEQKSIKLNRIVDEASKRISAYDDSDLKDFSEKINHIKKEVRNSLGDFKKLKSLEKQFKLEIKNKEQSLKLEQENPTEALNAMSKVNQAVIAMDVSYDIYNKHKHNDEQLAAVQVAIEQADLKFKQLKDYEQGIEDAMVPILDDMSKSLNNVAVSLKGKSQVTLDVTKWKVQSALKDMKLQMKQLTRGFQVEDSLARYIEKLEETMTTLIVIFDRIQNYQEQQNLANFIADISSVSQNNIDISDPELSSAIEDLELTIRSNLVLHEYKVALKAFKQWVFPFASVYLDDSVNLEPLMLNNKSNSLTSLVRTAVAEVDNIKSKLSEYKSMIKSHDKFLFSGYFDSDHDLTTPFCVWKNDKYKLDIKKLLSGNTVTFKSDVLKSSKDKDAIKFNLIEFHLKTVDNLKQVKLDEILRSFTIKATHLGNSQYRYDDKVFLISSDSQTIEYSFEKNSNGDPIHKNSVYSKIKDGEMMLSPYAVWELSLINATDKAFFSDLLAFQNEIDLELVGHGNYVKRETKISNLKVEDYYKEELYV